MEEAKKKHTKNTCPGRKKTSAICSLLQIAAPLANESLDGCASAIALFRRHYGQRGFKVGRGVDWRGGGDLLPARIALYVSKSSALLMGLNGAEWGSVGVCWSLSGLFLLLPL